MAAGLHRLAGSMGEPELGVDATMVSRWERGTRRPRPRYIRLLCRLFELPAEQLGMVEDADVAQMRKHTPDALEDDDLERRDFIQKVAALLGATSVPLPRLEQLGREPWERLSRALHRPGSIDSETLDHLERITVSLESLGPTHVSSRDLIGPVTSHLDAIALLLQGSLPATLRPRLCSLAAETAGFAGWLHWNMDDPVGAAGYFATALDAAEEGDDRALRAYLAGCAACQPPYRETPRRRVQVLQGLAWAEATPSSRVWLAAKEADGHALLGDVDGCLRALERAERAMEAVAGEDSSRRPRFSNIQPRWLRGERGASLAKLGRTEEARAILEPLMVELGPTHERDRLWLGTALASSHVQDGEPEEACRVASTVLERAARMRLDPVLRIVQGLSRELDAYGSNAAVQDLGERVRSTVEARVAG